ncbi:MAG: hypothetical protein IKA64_07040 [Clostridia bacterium]|nr:hypothetical protein [Clostridia bacterium]
MTVTFFGHRDCPDAIRARLITVLENLIENEGADTFFVGNNGAFDAMVYNALKKLRARYSHIRFNVVLSYMPREYRREDAEYYRDTLLPEEIAEAVPRFAIDKRNLWLLKKSDTVVTYVVRSFGGAAKFKARAKRLGRTVIELSETL